MTRYWPSPGKARTLITNDPDFGELIVRYGHAHTGVLLFRLKTTEPAVTIARLQYVLDHYSDWLDQFLIITERRVRVWVPRPTAN